MTTWTTAQLDAWGEAAAKLQQAFALQPTGCADAQKAVKVRQAIEAYLNDLAVNCFSSDKATLFAAIEASAGYINTGGTGALCS